MNELLFEPVVIPVKAHTLAGFRAWALSRAFPLRGRVSFLDKHLYIDMSPEELETHSKVKVEITIGVQNLNKKERLGEFFPDGTLLTNLTAKLSTEPDAVFALWESLESGRARLIPRESKEGQFIELEGTPDWVLEIVSRSSVRKDTRRLREQYHRAGIREYWLIDARGEEIDFQVLVHTPAGYESTLPGRGGWQLSPVFGRLVRLTRRRGRMNLWEYTLQMKRPR